jgi:uncharacterized protein (TIGR00730 family)
MEKIEKVCIYCASSHKVDSIYFEAAGKLAAELVNNNISIVYGGGAVGLMGKVADTAMNMGGEVTGILPRFMDEVEWGHKSITRLILVDDMRERKRKMIEESDAVIALPGGTGTIEELFEVITLKRLGQYTQPIILLNTKDYYKHLIAFVNQMVQENFLRAEHLSMMTVINEPHQIMEALNNSPAWGKDAINFAAV